MRRIASTPLSMFLAVLMVCVVSATALTLAYGATSEQIAEQERIAREKAVREALPEAEEFEEVDEETLSCLDEAAEETPVSVVFLGSAEGGQVVGIGVLTAPRGYGGPDADGRGLG